MTGLPPAPVFLDWLPGLDLTAQHLLLREMHIDRWWRIWPDGTRTLIGSYGEVERLVRSWLQWSDPQPFWDPELGGWRRPPAEYVGPHYTVARVTPAVLDRWPDVGDDLFTKENAGA